MTDRSAIGGSGKQPKAHYGEPMGRIFENAQQLKRVVVFGEDQNGEPVIWSTLDERQTTELLSKNVELTS